MKQNNFLNYLAEKHKLSLRNIRTGQEIWHIFTSRLNFILAFMSLVIILFIIILTTVAYTSILDFIPGYPGNKSRRLIVENVARLDSMEMQVREWEHYNRSLSLILEGYAVQQGSTDTVARTGIKGNVFPRSIGDSLLRHQIETDSNYMLVHESRRRAELTFDMVAPVRGMIVKPFSPKNMIFGIEIAPQPSESIMAVMGGTVILATWDPNSGYTMVVEHAANMVSIYKKVARVLCKTGQRVKSGEAIAVTGTGGEGGKTPSFVFELWKDGNPVDPENYITF